MGGQTDTTTAMSRSRPSGWVACWTFDDGPLMRVPKNWPRRVAYSLIDQRYSTSVLLRLTQYYFDRSRPGVSRLVSRLNGVLNGVEVNPRARVGAGVVFHHRRVVIGGRTVIGEGAHLFANVNFGLRSGGYPTIGDRVTVFANAVITGPITIGDEAVVGPNSVVLGDVKAGAVVAGAPAKVLGARTGPADPTVQYGASGHT
jgi:serine O-acetyltransferase